MRKATIISINNGDDGDVQQRRRTTLTSQYSFLFISQSDRFGASEDQQKLSPNGFSSVAGARPTGASTSRSLHFPPDAGDWKTPTSGLFYDYVWVNWRVPGTVSELRNVLTRTSTRSVRFLHIWFQFEIQICHGDTGGYTLGALKFTVRCLNGFYYAQNYAEDFGFVLTMKSCLKTTEELTHLIACAYRATKSKIA